MHERGCVTYLTEAVMPKVCVRCELCMLIILTSSRDEMYLTWLKGCRRVWSELLLLLHISSLALLCSVFLLLLKHHKGDYARWLARIYDEAWGEGGVRIVPLGVPRSLLFFMPSLPTIP